MAITTTFIKQKTSEKQTPSQQNIIKVGQGLLTPHRLALYFRAFLVRTLTYIVSEFDLYLSLPIPKKPAFSKTIESTVGTERGVRKFKLLFWTPPGYGKASNGKKEKYPVLVNFHGGGFTIGKALDDARWITAVMAKTPVVVVSVNYSLAPEHPFPSGIEDGASAILWLWEHADELNLDITKTALSGFSAGGNFTYTVPLCLHDEIAARRAAGQLDTQHEKGRLVGLASFYPSTDWDQTREQRTASNSDTLPGVPTWAYELFDDSYLYPQPDRRTHYLSPAHASSELLVEALPQHMALVACGGDPLMPESERFAEQLRKLGKHVENMRVLGVGHGWDKKPRLWKGDKKRDEAYVFAIQTLREAWGFEAAGDDYALEG